MSFSPRAANLDLDTIAVDSLDSERKKAAVRTLLGQRARIVAISVKRKVGYQMIDASPSKGRGLEQDGTLETVDINGQVHILVESIFRYLGYQILYGEAPDVDELVGRVKKPRREMTEAERQGLARANERRRQEGIARKKEKARALLAGEVS